MRTVAVVLACAFFTGCIVYRKLLPSPDAQITISAITKNCWKHVSILDIPDYGTFPCNGLVYMNNGEAIVLDAPVSEQAAIELMYWITETEECEIKAVVVNHFHVDCLGSLKVFHEAGIPSYASALTIKLAEEDGMEVPQNSFEGELELKIGRKKVISKYFGPGHTRDNIVSYIPSEKVLFGGCLIKELDAGFGNLGDADKAQWSATVRKVKAAFLKVEYVVPGHGEHGGVALLDYTISKFEEFESED